MSPPLPPHPTPFCCCFLLVSHTHYLRAMYTTAWAFPVPSPAHVEPTPRLLLHPRSGPDLNHLTSSSPPTYHLSAIHFLLFSGNMISNLARHSERGKKTRQTEEEVARQHQGMDRSGVRQVPEGSGKQGQMEETGCEIICGAPNDPRG